jgi:hypothetical protein
MRSGGVAASAAGGTRACAPPQSPVSPVRLFLAVFLMMCVGRVVCAMCAMCACAAGGQRGLVHQGQGNSPQPGRASDMPQSSMSLEQKLGLVRKEGLTLMTEVRVAWPPALSAGWLAGSSCRCLCGFPSPLLSRGWATCAAPEQARHHEEERGRHTEPGPGSGSGPIPSQHETGTPPSPQNSIAMAE